MVIWSEIISKSSEEKETTESRIACSVDVWRQVASRKGSHKIEARKLKNVAWEERVFVITTAPPPRQVQAVLTVLDLRGHLREGRW